MSENTPGMGKRAEIEAADMSICFHGSEVYLAKTVGTEEHLIALRIKGHLVDPTGGVVELHPELKTYEFALNPRESVSIMLGILTGCETIMGAELNAVLGGLFAPKGEWN